jgi:bifunctional N-acetylglucosamine-1-phosphate-uridyltransferase/glucosamine-1-phosphate-acetyltransferase GlmU-like protein
MQKRLRARALDAGVGMIAPETVFLSYDTVLEADVQVGPYRRVRARRDGQKRRGDQGVLASRRRGSGRTRSSGPMRGCGPAR